MRWRPHDPSEWRRAFAWFPVTVGEWTVWLESYERRFMGDCYEVRLIRYGYDGMP